MVLQITFLWFSFGCNCSSKHNFHLSILERKFKMHYLLSDHDQRTKHTLTNKNPSPTCFFHFNNVGSFQGLANDTPYNFLILYHGSKMSLMSMALSMVVLWRTFNSWTWFAIHSLG
jgi:hypothetical protein